MERVSLDTDGGREEGEGAEFTSVPLLQAKAAFRTLDIRGEVRKLEESSSGGHEDGQGTAIFNEIVKFVLDPPPGAKFDLFATLSVRNAAVEDTYREKLISLGAVEAIVRKQLLSKRKEKRLAALLALLNLSFSRNAH
eukprot:367618-Hanusia_phi.AAC.1